MKLSIITINFNNKAGLEKTIESVMSQTWRDFEWIIIDGGSTDGSKDVIEELAKNPDANISYWCSEPDKGIYNAMNKGIAQANGEFLNFMNSGDAFFNYDTLEKVIPHLRKNCDIVFGKALHKGYDFEYEWTIPTPVDIYELCQSNICHQAMFVKSDLLNSGYDESYNYAADYAKWVELAMQGCSFLYIDETICFYDMTGISFTNKDYVKSERLSIQKRYIPQMVLDTVARLEKYERERDFQNLCFIKERYNIITKLASFLLKVFKRV